tara:strand:- start:9 stop:452 length:444 start_codon:yes stop_codon:yes gene_type:complete
MYALLIVVLLMVLLVEEEEDALALVTLPSAEANAVLCTNGAAALFPQPTGASLPDDDALPNPPSFAFFARLTLCATGFSLSQYTFNSSFLLLLLFLLDFDVDAFLPELLVVLLAAEAETGVTAVFLLPLEEEEEEEEGPSCSFISFA